MTERTEHPAYRLIEKYAAQGLVVDYVILEAGQNEPDPHKAAALAGIKIIAERWERYVEKTMAAHPHLKRPQFRIIRWDASGLAKEPYPAEHLFAEPDPYYENRPKTPNGTILLGEKQAYANAFLEPPYGSTLLTKDWQKLNKLLFSDARNLQIFSWSTNWSSYFDDGHEWWGAYYWTVYDREYELYTVIAASATD